MKKKRANFDEDTRWSAYHQWWDVITVVVLGSVLHDLVLAPEEDGDVEVVYPGLLGLGQLDLVEAEEARQPSPGEKPAVDGLGDLLIGVADPVHQRADVDEVVQVLHGRDERRGRRRGGDGARRRGRDPVVRRA